MRLIQLRHYRKNIQLMILIVLIQEQIYQLDSNPSQIIITIILIKHANNNILMKLQEQTLIIIQIAIITIIKAVSFIQKMKLKILQFLRVEVVRIVL